MYDRKSRSRSEIRSRDAWDLVRIAVIVGCILVVVVVYATAALE